MNTTQQKALNIKKGNNLIDEFSSGQSKVVGHGRYTVLSGKSKTGVCKMCQAKAGRHNIAGKNAPPYHPNCKCHLE